MASEMGISPSVAQATAALHLNPSQSNEVQEVNQSRALAEVRWEELSWQTSIWP